MSVEVGTAYLTIIPSARGFAGRLQSQIGGDMESAGREGGRRYHSGMMGVIAGSGAAVGAVALAGAAGVAALGVMGIKTGLDVAAGMETARISFTTMLGSAQKADTFLKQLSDFAAKTPFEFPELQTAASSLISAGIEAKNVIPIMTTLGNVTSGMGTGSEGVQRATVALQQMTAAGKIQAQDLNQLRDAGIPVYDLLSSALGKTKAEVAGLANSGKLGKDALDKMMNALETGKGLERFSGLMDKQSQSLSGLMSTAKDTLNMGLAKAVEPLIPLIKDGLGGASAFAAKALPVLSNALKSVIEGAIGLKNTLTPIFVQLGSVIGPAINTAKLAFGAFFAALQEGDVTSDGLIGKFETVGDFLHTNLPPAIAVAHGAFRAISAFIVAEVIPRVQGIIQAVQGFVAVALPIVIQFVEGMKARIAPLMPQIRVIFTTIGTIITGALDLIKAAIVAATTIIAFVWSHWGKQIMDFVAVVFKTMLNVIQATLNVVMAVVRTFIAIFHGDWSAAWSGVKDIVSTTWTLIKTVVSGALDNVKAALALAWAVIKTGAGAAWGGIVSAISGALGSLLNAVTSPFKTVLTWIRDHFVSPLNDMLAKVGVDFRIPFPSFSDGGAVGNGSKGSSAFGFDRGGWTGPGSKYQPAGVVHADEFVVRKESQNKMRTRMPGVLDYINAHGTLPGYDIGGLVGAVGGAVGNAAGAVGSFVGDIGSVLMDPVGALEKIVSSILGGIGSGPIAQIAGGALSKVGGGLADKVKSLLASIGGGVGAVQNLGGGRVSIGGKVLDATTANIFQRASGILGGLNLMQGSWSTSVSASGGTHSGSGAMDVWPANGDWKRAVDVIRSLGGIAWHRTPSQGPWAEHIHSITPGDPGLSSGAAAQVANYRAGLNGLVGGGPDNHGYFGGGPVTPLLFDRGGYLPTGASVVLNKTGAPEPLRRVDQGSGATHVWHVNTPDPYAIAAEQARIAAFVGG